MQPVRNIMRYAQLFTTMIIVCIAFKASDVVSSDLRQVSKITLQQGTFLFIKNASIGKPFTFYSVSEGSHVCYPLIVDGQHVDWVYAAGKTKMSLLFYKCVEDSKDSLMLGAPENAVPGGTRPETYTLKKADSKWELTQLNVPDYSMIAYDIHCDSFVAYWVIDDNTLFAYVYDLRAKRLVYEHEIESSREGAFGTDDPYAFGQPKWNDNCSSVEFPENYISKTPIRAEIKR